ncbi:Fc.00g023830.m01.CDS01 [Cosmosporella sp. VM-42]
MATTPNHIPLPGAEREGHAVHLACGGIYPCEILPSPGLDEVLSRIPKVDILHFAGHGVPDPGNALDSHLLLKADGPDGPVVEKLTLGKISGVSGGSGSWIAFLSACSTAEVRVRKLEDEGLHLAGAFQLAGSSHVIGSLWPVNDDVCVDVAGAFYRELVHAGGGRVSNRAAAVALQRAVAQVRARYIQAVGGHVAQLVMNLVNATAFSRQYCSHAMHNLTAQVHHLQRQLPPNRSASGNSWTHSTIAPRVNAESVSAVVGAYICHNWLQLASLPKYDVKTKSLLVFQRNIPPGALVCQSFKNVSRWVITSELNSFPPGFDLPYDGMMDPILNSRSMLNFTKGFLPSQPSFANPLLYKDCPHSSTG